MNAKGRTAQVFQDSKIDTKVILATLWATVMFCYLYADYFGLFTPGQLAEMNRGHIPPLGSSTDGVMLFVSLMMVFPSLMICASVALPARSNRVINFIMGIIYSVIIAITMWSGRSFFILYGVIEISLTLLVCYHAWAWPRSESKEYSSHSEYPR